MDVEAHVRALVLADVAEIALVVVVVVVLVAVAERILVLHFGVV